MSPTIVAQSGQQPVFLLSTPRAGSTVLGAILGSHSQVLCPPEPWLLLPLVSLNSDQQLVTAAYDHHAARRAITEAVAPASLDGALRAYADAAYNSLLRPSG